MMTLQMLRKDNATTSRQSRDAFDDTRGVVVRPLIFMVG